jgi:GNAT superfamily N-acetyltransferase
MGMRSAPFTMDFSARPVQLGEISPWRDLYREEMHCQIVHDSMHSRTGWTQSYLLEVSGDRAGYGSILIGGPWTGTRTVFEFYLAPSHRSRAFDLFTTLLTTSGATGMEVQTNDALLSVMLHTWARDIASEKIVLEDRLTTFRTLDGVVFCHRTEPEEDWVLKVNGTVAATGGILYHYNRPYGDIYMEVSEPFRQRGFGSFLVQELKRVCYELGSIPCARCNTTNIASRKTLQKAGFVPCAHILVGKLEAGGQ